jgi:hypothetical protein
MELLVLDLQPDAERLLKEGFFGYLGTSGMDNVPHVTPIIYVYDDKRIFFSTSKQARKLRNIRENSKVSFVVHASDPSDFFNDEAALVFGRIKVYDLSSSVLGSGRLLKVLGLFPRKYPEYARVYGGDFLKIPKAWRPTLFLSRLIIEISVIKAIFLRKTQISRVSKLI